MNVVIDNRETRLMTAIDNSIEYKVEQLNLGDITFSNGDGTQVVVERKSLSDLESSIKDGRYKNQVNRLLACSVPNRNIVFLIEGDLTHFRSFANGFSEKSLLSAMTSLWYKHGFTVLRTLSITETADWVVNTASKLARINCGPGVVFDPEPKRSQSTPQSFYMTCLTLVPGLSSASVGALVESFPTLGVLIRALREDDSQVYEIKIRGSGRRIAKSSIDKLVLYLTANDVL